MTVHDEENELFVEVVKDTVRVRTSRGGSSPSGAVENNDLRRETIELFRIWLGQKDKISKRRELEVLGQHLFEVLFSAAAVRTFIEGKLTAARHNKRRLRIQLVFEDAPDLAGFPWEYLCFAPPSGRKHLYFLAMEADLVLSRFISLEDDRVRLREDSSQLRLLVVVSEPIDPELGPVLADQVIEEVEKLKGRIEMTRLDQPTPDSLVTKLEEFKPHVVHFIGHGRFNVAEKQGEIALLDADEVSAVWCSDKIFAEYFVRSKECVPRLVLLHACESGKADGTHFAGMAPQMILAGVQAVVAMQHPITNKAAISFSKGFYTELAKGNPIDQAVQTARYKITLDEPRNWDSRVFGTPVLYMRSSDGILLNAEEPGVASRPEQRAAATRETLGRSSIPSSAPSAAQQATIDGFTRPEPAGPTRLPLIDGASRDSREMKSP
jgi:hypothetical protein